MQGAQLTHVRIGFLIMERHRYILYRPRKVKSRLSAAKLKKLCPDIDVVSDFEDEKVVLIPLKDAIRIKAKTGWEFEEDLQVHTVAH
jgi:hypothetical protein